MGRGVGEHSIVVVKEEETAVSFSMRIALATLAIVPVLCVQAQPSSSAKDPVAAFAGRWDLTLKAPDREYPSWI